MNNGSFDRSGDQAKGAGGGKAEETVEIDGRPARKVQYHLPDYRNASFTIIEADVVNPAFPIRHDTRKLAQALVDLVKEGKGA